MKVITMIAEYYSACDYDVDYADVSLDATAADVDLLLPKTYCTGECMSDTYRRVSLVGMTSVFPRVTKEMKALQDAVLSMGPHEDDLPF